MFAEDFGKALLSVLRGLPQPALSPFLRMWLTLVREQALASIPGPLNQTIQTVHLGVPASPTY